MPDLIWIPGKITSQLVNSQVKVSFTPVNINLYLKNGRRLRDYCLGHVWQTKKLGTIIGLASDTTDYGNKNIVTLTYQRQDVPHKDLYWQAGISYHPGRAL
jgi:hypothetical protein